jgi:hypothetical protein
LFKGQSRVKYKRKFAIEATITLTLTR